MWQDPSSVIGRLCPFSYCSVAVQGRPKYVCVENGRLASRGFATPEKKRGAGLETTTAPANTGRQAGKQGRAQRTILLVATPGTISESLLRALESEYPWIVVESVATVEAACAEFSHPVALILVDAALLEQVEASAAELMRRHPAASGAVMMPDYPDMLFELPRILDHRLVRAVLPMNVKLDVWLCVIELLLLGGEYFPAALVHSYAKKFGAVSGAAAPAGTTAIRLSDLTAREVQILELVSRGLQNKMIAAELSLSEHTVKIHLHNIISKLGTHNRTEAAARFRDHQASRATAVSFGGRPYDGHGQ